MLKTISRCAFLPRGRVAHLIDQVPLASLGAMAPPSIASYPAAQAPLNSGQGEKRHADCFVLVPSEST